MCSWIINLDGITYNIKYQFDKKTRYHTLYINDIPTIMKEVTTGFLGFFDYIFKINEHTLNLVKNGKTIDLSVDGTFINCKLQYRKNKYNYYLLWCSLILCPLIFGYMNQIMNGFPNIYIIILYSTILLIGVPFIMALIIRNSNSRFISNSRKNINNAFLTLVAVIPTLIVIILSFII